MDSDGERDDDEETQNNLFLSTQQDTYTCTAYSGDEIDGPRIRFPCPRARVTSMVIRNCVTLIMKLEIFYSCLTINYLSRPKPMQQVSLSILFNFLTLSVQPTLDSEVRMKHAHSLISVKQGVNRVTKLFQINK